MSPHTQNHISVCTINLFNRLYIQHIILFLPNDILANKIKYAIKNGNAGKKSGQQRLFPVTPLKSVVSLLSVGDKEVPAVQVYHVYEPINGIAYSTPGCATPASMYVYTDGSAK